MADTPRPLSAMGDDVFRTDDHFMAAKILDAAEECFRLYGIRRTRMDDVAAKVGLARPNLYRFVPSKDALVQLVSLDHTRRVDDERRERIPLEGPVAEVITESLVMGVEMARHDPFDIELLSPANLALTLRLMGSTDADPVVPRPAYWYPVFEYGRSRGEIRDGLTNRDLTRWMGATTISFLQRPVMFMAPELSWQAAEFVVPALLTERALKDWEPEIVRYRAARLASS